MLEKEKKILFLLQKNIAGDHILIWAIHGEQFGTEEGEGS